jgi:hypothetical protein
VGLWRGVGGGGGGWAGGGGLEEGPRRLAQGKLSADA